MKWLWAVCLEVHDLLVSGGRSLLWLQYTPGFKQNGVCPNQTSSRFPYSPFPVLFELEEEAAAARALPSSAAFVFTLSVPSGLVELRLGRRSRS